MWLPRLWFIGILLIATATVTGVTITPDQGAERARFAENITLQLKQHALEQAAELSSLAGDPELASVMSSDHLWGNATQRTAQFSELRDTLLHAQATHLTQDLMILDSKLSQVCEGERCTYEPLLTWNSELSIQECIEILKLKPLHLTERISPPKWGWIGTSYQLVVATSVSQKTTLGVLLALGPSAEQLFKKELERNKLSSEHFALFVGNTQLTSLQVDPPQTNAAQELMVKAVPTVKSWHAWIEHIKTGFTSFSSDPLPLIFALILGFIGILLDMRRSSGSVHASEELLLNTDWDYPPANDLRVTESSNTTQSLPPQNPTSDLPLSTRPEDDFEGDYKSDFEDEIIPSSASPRPQISSAQIPSVPPIIHGEAATPLHAIKTDEFEPAEISESADEGLYEHEMEDGDVQEHIEFVDQESEHELFSEQEEDAFDDLFEELSDAQLEGDSFVQELGSFLEGELGDLLGAQGHTHLAALDQAAWSQAPIELPAPVLEDTQEYENFERDISDGLDESFADEINDADAFFRHIGLVSSVGYDAFGDIELIHSIAPSQSAPEEILDEETAFDDEEGDIEESDEVQLENALESTIDFKQLGLELEDADPSLDEVEVILSTQPTQIMAQQSDALFDFEGSLDLEDDFPDVLEDQNDQFHPDLDLTPLPSEEDFRRTPEKEHQLGELLHGVASIPPVDERPTTMAPLTQEAPIDDISAELMGQEDDSIYSDEWVVPSLSDDSQRRIPTAADLLDSMLLPQATMNSLDELPVSLDDSDELENDGTSLDRSQDLEEGFVSQWEEGEDDEPVHYRELQQAEEMALNPTPYALPTLEKMNELSLNPIDAPLEDEEEGEHWVQESVAPTPMRTSEGDLSDQQLKALNAFMSFAQETEAEEEFAEEEFAEEEFDGVVSDVDDILIPTSTDVDLLENQPFEELDSDFEYDPGSMIEKGELPQISDLMSLMESEPAPRSVSAEEMGFFHDAEPESYEPESYEPESYEPESYEPESYEEGVVEAVSEEILASMAVHEELELVASMPPPAIPPVDTVPDLRPVQSTPEPIDWAAKARARRQVRLDHYKEVHQAYCLLKQEHEKETRLPSLKDFIDQLNQARQKYIDKHGCLDVRFEAKLNKKGRVSIKSHAHTPV